jgi:hypothetical protein
MVGKNTNTEYKNLGAIVRVGVKHKKALRVGMVIGGLTLTEEHAEFIAEANAEADEQTASALGLWAERENDIFSPA